MLLGALGEFLFAEWQVEAADRALSSGLVGLAERIYREQLERGDLAADQRVDMQLNLAAALIVQQDFGALRLVLAAIPQGASAGSLCAVPGGRYLWFGCRCRCAGSATGTRGYRRRAIATFGAILASVVGWFSGRLGGTAGCTRSGI